MAGNIDPGVARAMVDAQVAVFDDRGALTISQIAMRNIALGLGVALRAERDPTKALALAKFAVDSAVDYEPKATGISVQDTTGYESYFDVTDPGDINHAFRVAERSAS